MAPGEPGGNSLHGIEDSLKKALGEHLFESLRAFNFKFPPSKSMSVESATVCRPGLPGGRLPLGGRRG